MNRPSLLAQLVRVQVAVVALTCLLLVAGALVASAFIARAEHDATLGSLAEGCAAGIAQEEEESGTDATTSAGEFFGEATLPGYRYELIDRSGRVLASSGFVLDTSSAPGTPGTWSFGGNSEQHRGITLALDAEHSVRIITIDAPMHHVRLVAMAALAAVPLAAIAGALIGRAAVRRRLRPLLALADAASRLDPGRGAKLGVGVDSAELGRLERSFDDLLARFGDALHREGRFARAASHELRTPLTLLQLELESAKEHGGASESIDRALRQVQRLDQLTEALLLLHRAEIHVGRTELVNACDALREGVDRQRRVHGASTTVIEIDAPDEILIRGSEDLILRVIENLVENALHHAPGAAILASAKREGDNVVLAVDDAGPGLPSTPGDIFEPFGARRDRPADATGHGLGLAFVAAVARAHGGSAFAQPSPLGGARVGVRLPALPDGSA